MKQLLKFSHFGADDGQIVIYFHGAPGAPEECKIFDLDGKSHGLTFICFDRFSVDASVNGEAYYKLLAEEISKKSAGKQVDVIGFSIGAFIALQTCRYMTDGTVKSLHLVSAAAPLEAGDYLEAMAGRQVFQLAKTFPPCSFYCLTGKDYSPCFSPMHYFAFCLPAPPVMTKRWQPTMNFNPASPKY